MITLNQLRDDIVDAVVELLIQNQVINNINELQYIIDETGQIAVGRLNNNQPIILNASDYQGMNEEFISVIDGVAKCLAGETEYNEFNSEVLEYITEETYSTREQNTNENYLRDEYPLIRFKKSTLAFP